MSVIDGELPATDIPHADLASFLRRGRKLVFAMRKHKGGMCIIDIHLEIMLLHSGSDHELASPLSFI
jgi:hypothetical protein